MSLLPGLLLALLFSGQARAECSAWYDTWVVINEVLPNPDGADGGNEWIELHNDAESMPSVVADLSGWTIERAKSPGGFAVRFTFPQGTILEVGGFVLVGESNVVAAPGVDAFTVDGTLDFGNAGSTNSDAVLIRDCDGEIADSIVYGGANAEGEVFSTDDLFTVDDDELAELPGSGRSLARVDDGADTDDLTADFVLDSTPTPGTANDAEAVDPVEPPAECDTAGVVGSVVINEFFPDPGSGVNPEGNSDTGYEWLELYNPGSAPVDASGWVVEKASNPDSWSARVVLPANTVLDGGAHLLIAEHLVAVPGGITPLVLPSEGTLGLGNSQDAVRLVDCTGAAIDTVVYGGGNDDGFVDDRGVAPLAGETAPDASSDRSIARRVDGLDTDDSGADFLEVAIPTPGAANEDLTCRQETTGVVKINEFLPNPAGTDSEALSEWVELLHTGSTAIDVSTWVIAKATSAGDEGANLSALLTFPAGTMLEPGQFLVVGGVLAEEVELFTESFDLGSGSAGDGVYLVDCAGTIADSALYGGDNEDGLTEDDGGAPEFVAGKPSDDQCVARIVDGEDSDESAEDFAVTAFCTPGAANEREIGDDPDDPVGGCNRGPNGGGPVDAGPREGCATVPMPMSIPVMLLLGGFIRRRR